MMSFRSLIAVLLTISFALGQIVPANASAAASPIRQEVILIEDAHSDEAAQLAIEKLLRQITATEKIDFVAVEGAWTRLTPEVLRFNANPKTNRDILLHLVKHGEISGADFFAATKKTDLVFAGVETKELYAKYFHILQNILRQHDRAESFSRTLREHLMARSSRELNPNLRDLIRHEDAFSEGRLKPLPYLEILKKVYRQGFAQELTALRNQLDYPNILHILALEKKPIAKEAESEYQQFKSSLTPQLRALPIRNLLEIFLDKKKPLPASENLKTALRFHLLKEELAGTNLFEEINTLTENLLQKLARTEPERIFLNDWQNAKLFSKLLKVELSVNEWKQIRAKQFPYREMDSLYQLAHQFYIGAELRNEAMSKNLVTLFGKHRARKAVLVTGGFHTASISKLLAARGILTRVITPERMAGEPEGFSHLADTVSLNQYRDSILHTSVTLPKLATMPKPDAAQPVQELLSVDPAGIAAVEQCVRAFKAASLGAETKSEIAKITADDICELPFFLIFPYGKGMERKGYARNHLFDNQLREMAFQLSDLNVPVAELEGMYKILMPGTEIIQLGIFLKNGRVIPFSGFPKFSKNGDQTIKFVREKRKEFLISGSRILGVQSKVEKIRKTIFGSSLGQRQSVFMSALSIAWKDYYKRPGFKYSGPIASHISLHFFRLQEVPETEVAYDRVNNMLHIIVKAPLGDDDAAISQAVLNYFSRNKAKDLTEEERTKIHDWFSPKNNGQSLGEQCISEYFPLAEHYAGKKIRTAKDATPKSITEVLDLNPDAAGLILRSGPTRPDNISFPNAWDEQMDSVMEEALDSGLKAIVLVVGRSGIIDSQAKQKSFQEILMGQLKPALINQNPRQMVGRFFIAYQPPATAGFNSEEIQGIHQLIRKTVIKVFTLSNRIFDYSPENNAQPVTAKFFANKIPIVFAGKIPPGQTETLMSKPDVAGILEKNKNSDWQLSLKTPEADSAAVIAASIGATAQTTSNGSGEITWENLPKIIKTRFGLDTDLFLTGWSKDDEHHRWASPVQVTIEQNSHAPYVSIFVANEATPEIALEAVKKKMFENVNKQLMNSNIPYHRALQDTLGTAGSSLGAVTQIAVDYADGLLSPVFIQTSRSEAERLIPLLETNRSVSINRILRNQIPEPPSGKNSLMEKIISALTNNQGARPVLNVLTSDHLTEDVANLIAWTHQWNSREETAIAITIPVSRKIKTQLTTVRGVRFIESSKIQDAIEAFARRFNTPNVYHMISINANAAILDSLAAYQGLNLLSPVTEDASFKKAPTRERLGALVVERSLAHLLAYHRGDLIALEKLGLRGILDAKGNLIHARRYDIRWSAIASSLGKIVEEWRGIVQILKSA